jgi:AmiR/NasT family two-component response regulator
MDGMQPSGQSAPTTCASVARQPATGAPKAARDAVVERAKGVLMGRYLISEQEAHDLLRKHARNGNLRLVDVALAVLDSYVLLDGRRS